MARRVCALVVLICARAGAVDWLPPLVVAGQATVVWQRLPSFRSPFVGPRSLRPGPDDAVSHNSSPTRMTTPRDGPYPSSGFVSTSKP